MTLSVNRSTSLLLLIKQQKSLSSIFFLSSNRYLIAFNTELFPALFGPIRKVVSSQITSVEYSFIIPSIFIDFNFILDNSFNFFIFSLILSLSPVFIINNF